MSMRTIGVRLRLLVGDYKRDADEAGQSTDKLSERIHRAGDKSKKDFDQIATGATIAGAALVAAATVAVVAFAKFDKQMSEVGAVSGATSEDLDKLRQAALDAGAATVFSASQAAEAEAELAKAGISTADILGGALAGSLDLAAAGSLDLATAAEIAAAAMNTFKLKGSDVGHIADVLAAAANKSSAGVEDLGQGLQQVGLIAAQVNFGLDETVALLAAFADYGLKGSDGATSLKTALLRLAAPTGEAAKLMQALGISMYDVNGNLVDSVNIAGQLHTALKDLSPAQRNAALNTIFGSDAIRAANILYQEGADGIREYIDAVDDQGAASRVASTKLDNLAGDVEQLTGSLETLFITSGEGADSPLRNLTQRATLLTNAFGELPDGVKSTTVTLVAGLGVSLLMAGAFGKLRIRTAEYAAELARLGPLQRGFGRGLTSTVGAAGKAGAAVAALAIAGAVLDGVIGGELKIKTTELERSLFGFGQTGQATGELLSAMGGDVNGLQITFKNATSSSLGFQKGLEGLFGASVGGKYGAQKTVERIEAIDAALLQMRESGNAEGAQRAWERLWKEAEKAGLTVDEFRSLFPGYLNGISSLGVVTSKTADHIDDAAKANLGLIRSFEDAALSVNGLKAAFDSFNGGALGFRATARDVEQSLDDMQEALRESGGSMDIHTEKGRNAQAALDEYVQKAAEFTDAEFRRTGSVDAANKTWDRYIEQLKKTLKQAGYTDKEIQTLIDTIAYLPDKPQTVDIKVKVSVDKASLSKASAEISGSLSLGPTTGHFGFRWGGVVQHAQSGLLNAGIYSGGPLYAFAEPATRGEAFIPKSGNYGRSMGILQEAAGWYGAQVVPAGAGWYGTGGGGTHTVVVDSIIRDESGRKIVEKVSQFAINTGRAPADVWSTKRR